MTNRERMRGSRIITWVVVSIVVALAIFAILDFMRGSRRPMVSRVRSDQRSLATAIEAYYVDHNIYPPWGVGADSYNGRHSDDPVLRRLPTFRMGSDGKTELTRVTSTTHSTTYTRNDTPDQSPTAYITSYPADPYAPVKGATFVYWSVFPGDPHPSDLLGNDETTFHGGVGWIVVSPGPDRIYDIPGDFDVYDPTIAQPSPRLLGGANKAGRAFTYDPTNGTASPGDIWRVKQ